MIMINNGNLTILNANSNNIEQVIKETYEGRYYSIYDYKYITIGDKSIVLVKDKVSFKSPKFTGDTSKKVSEIFNFVSEFEYSEFQSNPNKVLLEGGNCQALSIVFKEVCRNNQIACALVGTPNHVYNIVVIDDEYYKVDVVEKIIEKVGVEEIVKY
ncbi:Uncharacterised protein [Clostridium paraputrificum]|uniref:Uncharacterized protein n=2 Tax=Clostridium paraputrificum TaxID=29363 RepID=A0A6N3EQS1_9CLOT